VEVVVENGTLACLSNPKMVTRICELRRVIQLMHSAKEELVLLTSSESFRA
jgi:hypothetical protein